MRACKPTSGPFEGQLTDREAQREDHRLDGRKVGECPLLVGSRRSYSFALVCTVPAGPARAAEPKKCTFTTTDTERPDTLEVLDTDGDDFCDWPADSRSLHGTLTFPTGTQIEFRGNTSITADRIEVESGAVLAGISSRLHDLKLRGRDGVQASGELNVRAADDVFVLSDTGDINLFGPTRLVGADSVLVQTRGSVRIAPPDIDSIDVGAFTVLGCNDTYVRANGGNGKIITNRSRIGGRKVRLDTKASLSVTQNKSLTVLDSVITSRTGDTGCASGNTIIMRSDDVIYVGNSKVRAATNISFTTRHPDLDDLCLADGTELEAKGGLGTIDFRGVRGRTLFKTPGVEPDLIGRVLGGPIELDECSIPQ